MVGANAFILLIYFFGTGCHRENQFPQPHLPVVPYAGYHISKVVISSLVPLHNFLFVLFGSFVCLNKMQNM